MLKVLSLLIVTALFVLSTKAQEFTIKECFPLVEMDSAQLSTYLSSKGFYLGEVFTLDHGATNIEYKNSTTRTTFVHYISKEPKKKNTVTYFVVGKAQRKKVLDEITTLGVKQMDGSVWNEVQGKFKYREWEILLLTLKIKGGIGTYVTVGKWGE
jgi:hypothetical protein